MPFDGGVTEAALLAGAAEGGLGAAATLGTGAAVTDAALTAGALGATDIAATGALTAGTDLAATGALAGGAGAGLAGTGALAGTAADLAGTGALAGGGALAATDVAGTTGAGLLGTSVADAAPAAIGLTSSTPADIGLLSSTATPALTGTGATMAATDPAMVAMNAGQDIAASGNVVGSAAPTLTTDAGGTVMTTGLPQAATDAGGTTMTGGQAGGDIFSKLGAKWDSMTLGQKLQAGGKLGGLVSSVGKAAMPATPTAGNQTTMRPGTPGSPRGGEALISAIVQQMLQRRNQAMQAQLGQTGQPIVYAPTTGLLGF